MLGVAIVVAFSVALSLVWLGGAGYFVLSRLGGEALLALDPVALAQVAGVTVGPVAVIWLAAGLFGLLLTLRHQLFVIRQLLGQLRRTADQGEMNSRALGEWRVQARHEAFYRTLDLALDDINATLASFALRIGLCTAVETDGLWRCYRSGNRSVFCKLFRAAAERDPAFAVGLRRLVAADARLRAEMAHVLGQYERLVKLGNEHDGDRLVLDLIQDGALGAVQALLSRAGHLAGESVPTGSSAGEEKEPEPPVAETPLLAAEDGDETRPTVRRRRNLFAALASRAQAHAFDRPLEEERSTPGERGESRPFSPLTPDFPKHDIWPHEPEDRGP
ncbi:MAG: Uncharacterized protein FD149_2523 [Rhodospirillaceae bacterium]|nr:MAG: Uncharacterized protein FD149_2523 [Rhodospirillaceae bacterium]